MSAGLAGVAGPAGAPQVAPPPRPGARAGRWRAPAIAGAAALCVGAAFAVQASQPRERVVVARHDLVAGQRVTSADVTAAAVPAGPGRDRRLLPASLIGLVPGQYVARAVLAGAPLLDDEIHPGRAGPAKLPPAPGLTCGPR